MSTLSGIASHWRSWLLSLIITISVFWYLFSQINSTELIAAGRGMTPRYLGVFLLLLLGGVVARAIRFWILLERAIPLRFLTVIVLVRNLFVDLLPARLGEVSYVYLVTKRAKRPVENVLASLILAIAFDIVALAPLLLLAIIAVGGNDSISGPWQAFIAIALGCGAFAAARLIVPLGYWASEKLKTFGQKSSKQRTKVASLLRSTSDAIAHVWQRGLLIQVLLISLVVRLCKFGSYYFLVLAIFGGLDLDVSDTGFFRVFLGVVSAELAAALPISGVAGFGTFEAAWAFSFTQLGFERSDAIISGILTHGVSQVVEYSMGALALLFIMRPAQRSGSFSFDTDRFEDK